MPQPIEILAKLTSIANDYAGMAIFWHGLFFGLIVVLIKGQKPSKRVFSAFLGIPLLSVSTFAWISGNPFNGSTFALFGILLLIFGVINSVEKVSLSPLLFRIIGIIIIMYGLVYPHFLSVNSFYEYFYSAPTGLVPCPTLSVVLGFAILYNGFNSKKWSITLLIIGFFYALFGMFRLGVWLDSGLLIANITLLIQVISMKKISEAA